MLITEVLTVNKVSNKKDTPIGILKKQYDYDEDSPLTDYDIAKTNMSDFDNIRKNKPKLKNNILGSGVESIVFSSNSPRNQGVVTKLIKSQSKPAEINPTIKFLAMAGESGNPYLPKVYKIKQISKPNNWYEFAVEVEKFNSTLGQYLNEYKDDAMLILPLLKQLFVDDVAEELSTDLAHIYLDLEYLGDAGKLNKNLKSTLKQIYNTTGNNNFELNLHNIMVRHTKYGGQVVLTDPLLPEFWDI